MVTAAPGSVRVRAQKSVLVDVPALDLNAPRRLFARPVEPVARCTLDAQGGELAAGVAQVEEWFPTDHDDVDTLEARHPRKQAWSARSRARMMYRFSTLDFTELPGIPEMLTLTYPEEWPRDGRLVKDHLDMFRKRWLRRWGAEPVAVWKLEFQRRGAPHYHLYCGRPVVPYKEFQAWAKQAWHEIVTGCAGGCEHRHAFQGAWLDRQFVAAVRSKGKIAGYFSKHGAKGKKSYQNKAPEGFENVGRWWGYWGLKVHEREIEIDVQTMIDVRRELVKLRKSRTGWKCKAPSRLIGMWSMSADGYAMLARLLALEGVDLETGEACESPPRLSFAEWARRYDPSPALVGQLTGV